MRKPNMNISIRRTSLLLIEDSKSESLIEDSAGEYAENKAQQGSGKYIQWVMHAHIYLRIANGSGPGKSYPGPFFYYMPAANKKESSHAKMIGRMVGNKTVTT